jgi:hypothetical protein
LAIPIPTRQRTFAIQKANNENRTNRVIRQYQQTACKRTDKTFDVYKNITDLVTGYKKAVDRSGVKRIVHLSSIGAHTDQGVGLLKFHFMAESILKTLPADVSIKFMRPVGFYGNLLQTIEVIIKVLSILWDQQLHWHPTSIVNHAQLFNLLTSLFPLTIAIFILQQLIFWINTALLFFIKGRRWLTVE